MKRFFKKLAFATLALSVVLVSSCKVEDIRTTFTADNAVFTVEISVYDATTSTDVTREATITTTAQGVSVSGNKLVITGNPAIEAQTIAVTATYKGVSKTKNVKIYAVLAGGRADSQEQIVVNSPDPGYTIDETGETSEDVVGTFFSSHAIASHDYSHDPYTHLHGYDDVLIGHGTGHGNGNWLYNETEFMFCTTIDYKKWTGVKTEWCTKSYESGISDVEKTIVDLYFSTYAANTFKEQDATLDVKVSAFSMYTAYATRKYKTTTYAVYRTVGDEKTKIATITVKNVSTSAQYTEAAVPGHESVYHYGHGHEDPGHSHGGSNAGGGIIWAD